MEHTHKEKIPGILDKQMSTDCCKTQIPKTDFGIMLDQYLMTSTDLHPSFDFGQRYLQFYSTSLSCPRKSGEFSLLIRPLFRDHQRLNICLGQSKHSISFWKDEVQEH